MLETVSQSFLMVAITEMGDKTQLLAFVLASRFKKPWTIMAGILVATVLNHFLAAMMGSYLSSLFPESTLRFILAAIFFGFAIWILIPDRDEGGGEASKYGAFLTTFITFFLAEMGDKTQLATVALSARFQNLTLVTLGTTLGMLFSDGLAVFFGERITTVIPMKWVRIGASLAYLFFAILILFPVLKP